MLIPKPTSADAQRLSRLFASLGAEDRRTLLAFAEFLASPARAAAPPPVQPDPLPLPRPEREGVIEAIRRLTRTYPMLERATLLHETAALMSAHVLQGRPAAAVIDELEALFARHHAAWRAAIRPDDPGLTD